MTVPTYIPLGYDPERIGISMVHFGPGAFHRAHQAFYTHQLIAEGGGDYGICGVSLHSPSVRDALAPQNFVYTLAVLDKEVSYQAIGSLRDILVAPESPGAVITRLADPNVTTVTLTITEKGYTLDQAGKLDWSHPEIRHDRAEPERPKSAIGYLAAGLNRRRHQGLPGLTIISCDNLPSNGTKLKRAVLDFTSHTEPSLSQWIQSSCHFPSTMVDSITPATNRALKRRVLQETGQADAWPVQREAFTQWVIEDVPGAGLPPWDRVGAIFTTEVRSFELAKLRVLNGLHSSMAFLGLLLGLETVQEAARHRQLRRYLEDMCHLEILPTLPPVPGLDGAAYAESIFKRFENPAITHYLSQIAWDSSQKLPIRILSSVRANQAAGRASPRLWLAVAGWMAMVRMYARTDRILTDPLAEPLLELARGGAGVESFLALSQVFSPTLRVDEMIRRKLQKDFDRLSLGPGGVIQALERLGGSRPSPAP